MEKDDRYGMYQMSDNGLTLTDLFCGAGIGAVGFKLAGYKIQYAIDNNSHAVNTYNDNIGNHAILKDIRLENGDGIPYSDVIAGGFPCTPFSTAGKGNGVNDEKTGDLGYNFYRIIKEKQPKAFLMENVAGIVSKRHKDFFDELMSLFDEAGYNVSWEMINMWEYGIPQIRKRIIAVGVRKDLNKTFVFTEPIEESQRKNIRFAIGSLPEPNGINNHHGYGVRNDESKFIDKIAPGENWRALCKEDQQAFLGKAFFSGGGRTGFLRKVKFDNPAYTITSCMNGKNNAQIIDAADKYGQLNNIEIKEKSRRFTVRECLRLQTVPDWFKFSDSVPINVQYERCSGIPSLITYNLGKEIAKLLTQTT